MSEGKVVSVVYNKAKCFRSSTPDIPEDVENKMYVACFMSTPDHENNGPELSAGMCFADKEAIVKYANELKAKGYKIDLEYSFVIRPGETYAQRTDLGSILEETGHDPDKWEDEAVERSEEDGYNAILCIDTSGKPLTEIEKDIYLGCFTSTPNENYGDATKCEGYINEWMGFGSEADVLKYLNDVKTAGYELDLEYSFIIKPRKSFMDRTPLYEFLEAHNVDLSN